MNIVCPHCGAPTRAERTVGEKHYRRCTNEECHRSRDWGDRLLKYQLVIVPWDDYEADRDLLWSILHDEIGILDPGTLDQMCNNGLTVARAEAWADYQAEQEERGEILSAGMVVKSIRMGLWPPDRKLAESRRRRRRYRSGNYMT